MEIAKDIGVEKGKRFENLHLFAFWSEFVELATFQLLILCTLLSSVKFSRLFYHLIVLTSQLTFWKLLLSRSFVCCVECVCSFALCEKPHGFFLLTNFQGCWDFQKKKTFVKALLKVSSSALLDVLCSFLHSYLWKTSLITQFITYCFVESFQSVSFVVCSLQPFLNCMHNTCDGFCRKFSWFTSLGK